MTVTKTAADMDEEAVPTGPKLINTTASDPTVVALKKRYKHAREIEKLASGAFAVRFRTKKAVRFNPRKG